MQITNFKHQLLIAMPSMQGDFFAKSVVYIYEYSAETGALGFIINKPLSATLGNVLEHLNIKSEETAMQEMSVYSGGPVGPDQGFVLHDRMSIAQHKDDKDITISTSKEILQEIADGKGPDHFMVVLGYAGWGIGQLEREIQDNQWLLVPFQKNILFNIPVVQRWNTAAKLIGIDMSKLSSQAGHA